MHCCDCTRMYKPVPRVSRNSLSTLIYARRTHPRHRVARYLRRDQQCSFANCWSMMRGAQMINVTNNNASSLSLLSPCEWHKNECPARSFFPLYLSSRHQLSRFVYRLYIWINRNFFRERDGRLAHDIETRKPFNCYAREIRANCKAPSLYN